MNQSASGENLSLTTIQGILDWLGSEHSLTPRRHRFQEMQRRIKTVDESQLNISQQFELIELLDLEANKIITELLLLLNDAVLPIPKERRKLVRSAQDYLEALTAIALRLLQNLPENTQRGNAISIIINAFSQHLLLSFTSTFPSYVTIWKQLHLAYYLAVEMHLDLYRKEPNLPTVRDRYLHIILISCLQPAAFTAAELLFLYEYIAQQEKLVDLFDAAPVNAKSVFWVPSHEDAPAHAMCRRVPETSEARYFFACDAIAGKAKSHIKNIENGLSARSLDIPVFAMTPAGRGVLRRVAELWSAPVRRRFQRKMDTQRVYLRISLGGLWWSLNFPEKDSRKPSQWMVTNKSADGYAIMHVSGKTRSLHVGDIVALQEEGIEGRNWHWQLCMVRWALSENPEHLELGLQVISPAAVPAELIIPRIAAKNPERGKQNVLVLPELPPVRHQRAILIASGKIAANEVAYLLFSGERTLIQEVRTTEMHEQTSHIEMYEIATENTE